MLECSEIIRALDNEGSRTVEEYLRFVPASESGTGAVLLVGVVHDHPASLRRVTNLLTGIRPDILALELPPLAIPLFKLYAVDTATPPRLGGEMSTAIQAVDSTRTVGIDAPNRLYLRALLRRLWQGGHSISTILAILKDLGITTAHALACRTGSTVGRTTGLRPRVYSPIQHGLPADAPPFEQTEHEARHLSKQQAFLRAIEIPRARQIIDEAREEAMATRLQELRAAGDVVAIVGMEHLDTLDERLREPQP